jgi:hypothetical protein
VAAGIDRDYGDVGVVAHRRIKSGRTKLLHVFKNAIHRAPLIAAFVV